VTTNPDIPNEFCAAVFPDWVRIVTANAVIGAQYVERVLNGICMVLETDGLRFTIEDFMSGNAARTRQTLGMIETQLRETSLFEPSFSERLQRFTRRRNLVVHGLFVDFFKSPDEINVDSQKAQEYVTECEWVVEEAAQLVEMGFGIFRVLGNILLASHPNQPELDAILSDFDEFYQDGLGTMAPKFRQHLAS
jgi:hypothetical protein